MRLKSARGGDVGLVGRAGAVGLARGAAHMFGRRPGAALALPGNPLGHGALAAGGAARGVKTLRVLAQGGIAAPRIAQTACSLLEPQPKFLPPTNMTPFLAFVTNSVSKLSSACLASSHGSTKIRYLPGRITSVSMLFPNFIAGPLIFMLMLSAPFLGL